jgi:hypothetical protein
MCCLLGHSDGSARTMERPTMTAAYGFFIITVPGTTILISCTDGMRFLRLWNFTPGVLLLGYCTEPSFRNIILYYVIMVAAYTWRT